MFEVARYLPSRYRLAGKLDHQPFFILGSGRNGSTLLNRILNEHPDLFLPSEQYFLGPSIIRFGLLNYLSWNQLVDTLLSKITSEASHTWDIDLGDTKNQLIDLEDRDLQSIVDILYKTYSEQLGETKIWGDTTPLNTFYTKQLFSVFPKARYLFLIRDGRDVAASYKKGGEAFDEFQEVSESTSRWIHSIKCLDWLSKKAEVQIIKYEDLVTEPDQLLESICDFLNIDQLPKGWRSYTDHVPSTEFYQPKHHQNIKKAPNQASIGKWEEALDDQEKNYVLRKMKPYLSRFGYI